LKEPDEVVICAQCGASIAATSECCWLCHAAVEADDGANPYAAPESDVQVGRTFQISSLMIFIALLSVLLGVARLSIGLGIALVILVTPAYVRTVRDATLGRAEGKPLTVVDKVGTFFSSLAVVITILVASGAAFYATCWIPTGLGLVATELPNSDPYVVVLIGIFIGVPLGISVAIVVMVKLSQKLWPRK
jgi:hypothetical protein